MKIIVSPLNWGLGHASRSIALIRRFLADGHEVVIVGNGSSFALLKRYFPMLRSANMPEFDLRYSASDSQVSALARQIPKIIKSYFADYYYLDALLRDEHFDLVVSDNRFGFHSRRVRSVYITHQLFIRFPRRLRFLESFANFIHHRIIRKYDECWVPDYDGLDGHAVLSADLGHGKRLSFAVKYIGPLSRFEHLRCVPDSTYRVVAIVSGPEAQRTLFEQQLISRFRDCGGRVLLVRGLPERPSLMIRKGNIDLYPHLSDEKLVPFLLGCEKIICRAGYSSVMDMSALHVSDKVEWSATPGQTEQEYLLSRLV